MFSACAGLLLPLLCVCLSARWEWDHLFTDTTACFDVTLKFSTALGQIPALVIVIVKNLVAKQLVDAITKMQSTYATRAKSYADALSVFEKHYEYATRGKVPIPLQHKSVLQFKEEHTNMHVADYDSKLKTRSFDDLMFLMSANDWLTQEQLALSPGFSIHTQIESCNGQPIADRRALTFDQLSDGANHTSVQEILF